MDYARHENRSELSDESAFGMVIVAAIAFLTSLVTFGLLGTIIVVIAFAASCFGVFVAFSVYELRPAKQMTLLDSGKISGCSALAMQIGLWSFGCALGVIYGWIMAVTGFDLTHWSFFLPIYVVSGIAYYVIGSRFGASANTRWSLVLASVVFFHVADYFLSTSILYATGLGSDDSAREIFWDNVFSCVCSGLVVIGAVRGWLCRTDFNESAVDSCESP